MQAGGEALLQQAERTRVREYVQHTLYRPAPPRGQGGLPALVLTRRSRPVLTERDVYDARPGAGDVADMREYRRREEEEARAASEAGGRAGEETAADGEIGTASASSLEARSRYGQRNMAEVLPTERAALSAHGWKKYAERQLRDAILNAPLVIEHGTVLGVVQHWLSPTDQQVVWDLGNGVTLHQAALHGHVQADAIKKARATALHHLLEMLHEAADRGGSGPATLRRAG